MDWCTPPIPSLSLRFSCASLSSFPLPSTPAFPFLLLLSLPSSGFTQIYTYLLIRHTKVASRRTSGSRKSLTIQTWSPGRTNWHVMPCSVMTRAPVIHLFSHLSPVTKGGTKGRQEAKLKGERSKPRRNISCLHSEALSGHGSSAGTNANAAMHKVCSIVGDIFQIGDTTWISCSDGGARWVSSLTIGEVARAE